MVLSSIPSAELERELSAGERLLWSGQPKTGIRLRATDALMIPFSLLWAGFAVFWELGAINSGAPFFFVLWGLMFVCIGAYMTVGRFFVDAYVRGKTIYGVTNERVLIMSGLTSRTMQTLPLRTMPEIQLVQQRDGSGTIAFGPYSPLVSAYSGLAWSGKNRYTPPLFEMIPDAKAVYEIIRQAQLSVQ